MRLLIVGNALTIATMFAWWLFKDFKQRVDIFLFSNDMEYPKFIAHDLGLLITNTVLYFSVLRIVKKEYKPVMSIFLGFSIFRVAEYVLFHGSIDMLPIYMTILMTIILATMYISRPNE